MRSLRLVPPFEQHNLLTVLESTRRQKLLEPGLDGNRRDLRATRLFDLLPGSRPEQAARHSLPTSVLYKQTAAPRQFPEFLRDKPVQP